MKRTLPLTPSAMRFRFAAAALALAATLAACSSDKTGADGGGTVLIAMPNDPPTLFPLLVPEETSTAITQILFDKLARIGPDLGSFGDAGFTPELAKSWEWGRDSLSIIFHLDPAARFHDGTPVTAADVRYSVHITKDTLLGSPIASQITNIDSVSVVDSLTPVFWFKRRSPTQFYDAVFQVPPVPEHVYGKVPVAELKTSDVTRTPVGTGRFRFVKWEPGVRIELIADTTHPRGRARLDRVLFMLAQAPTASSAAVMAGEVDFFSAFPVDQLSRLDTSVVRAVPNPQHGYGFLGMNLRDRKNMRPHPVLGDPAVRRALSMSVDRRSMLTNVFAGAGRLAFGPFPTGGDLSDTTLSSPAYDTTAAAAALDAAGWRRGPNGVRMKNGRPLALEIIVPSIAIPRLRYAELIQEQLTRAGFQIEVDRVAPPQFGPRMGTHDFDMVLLTLIVDPSVSGIQQFWAEPNMLAGNTDFFGYRSAAVDAHLDSASTAPSRAAMKAHASRAFRTIIDDVPAVWLYSAGTVAVANRRIDLPAFPLSGWWNSLADWSIPADKRIDRDRIGLRPAAP